MLIFADLGFLRCRRTMSGVPVSSGPNSVDPVTRPSILSRAGTDREQVADALAKTVSGASRESITTRWWRTGPADRQSGRRAESS